MLAISGVIPPTQAAAEPTSRPDVATPAVAEQLSNAGTGQRLGGNITFGGQSPALDGQTATPGDTVVTENRLPGVERVILKPATPEILEQAIRSRALPDGLNNGLGATATGDLATAASPVAALGAGDGAPVGPASIIELARALRNDPDLIYEYVHDNVAYYPIWGVQKGALGAILDNAGTAFDQAALMVALLRESGYTASYVKGRLDLSAAQIEDWLGVDTSNVCAVLNLLSQGQIPIAAVYATEAGSCPGSTAALVRIKIDHLWVKVDIDGTEYVFDPSAKSVVRQTGIDLAAASGYDAAGYIGDARSGATINANYVQNINRSNIRGNLTDYAKNLADYVRTNQPAGTLDDLLGGYRIEPHAGGDLRQIALPYQDTSVPETLWSGEIPANYRTTLRVQYEGIDATYSSDALYGRRLTITYDGSNRPLLQLDGSTLATGTAIAPATRSNATFTVTHGAYASANANQTFEQQIEAGGTFLIGNGWGPAGRGLVELHRRRLNEAKASGSADTSEEVLGSALAVLSSTWIAQVNLADYIADRLAGTNTLFHHQVGIAGYNTAAYVDLPGNRLSVVSETADADTERAVFYSAAMHSSIFESTAVQQTTSNSAVSTVKLIDIAAENNGKIYNATSANYTSAVEPNLVSCAAFLPSFQQAIANGHRLILPHRCDINEADWTGAGYFAISGDQSSILAAINQFAGGFSTSPLPVPETVAQTQTNTVTTNEWNQSTGSVFGDPIDMARGHYLYAHEDVTVGTGGFPLSLGFQRLYSSGLRTRSGVLGNGWTHNFAVDAQVGSDGFQGLGEDSALDAVGTIVEKMVALDLLQDPAKPLDKMVIATLGQRWFGDQLLDNTVIVRRGLNGEVFVRLLDGSYNAPPGKPAKLSENADGSFSYETLHKARMDFDTAGRLSTLTRPNGLQVRLTYAGDELSEVRNSLGRVLTFTYADGRIAHVSDGVRSVSYTYDADGNLAVYTNADSKDTTFEYDLPGRMTHLYYPSNPTLSFATNVFDGLGRVKTQTNANGKLYTYYFAGWRSEEVGPGGVSRVSFVDALGKVLEAVDPLGRVTTNTYDGQSRKLETVLPEGNRIEYVYDDASCALQKRCTHQVATLRQVPKPSSGLPTLISRFVYDNTHNTVASSTDARGNETTYTYTSRGELLTVTQPADTSGVRPTTTYGYDGFSAPGFPAFYLRTSETSKIDASSFVVTETSYLPGNHYVPQTVVVDSGTGGLALATTMTYDALGNLIEIDGPRNDRDDKTAYVYDSERRLIQTTDALNNAAINAYDPDGRLIRAASQIGSQWLVSCRTYSPSGKLLTKWGPSETGGATTCPSAAAPVPVTEYSYDDLDRISLVTTYLPAGEGGNRVTETLYSDDNSMQRIRRGVGTAFVQDYAAFTYTDNGLVETVKDANANLTTYEYDGYDRKHKTRYPDPSQSDTSSTSDYEEYAYDANGNLASLRTRAGETVTLVYDDLDRLLSRTYPAATDNLVFAYDLLGRRVQAKHADNSHAIEYTWDNAGRLLSVTAGGKTLGYQYDPAGNRTRIDWPDALFHVTTAYDALNRPVEIKENGSTTLAAYAYDGLSRRTQVTLGNGTTTSYEYSPQSALASLALNLGGSARDVTWSYTRNQAQELTDNSWDNGAYLWMGYAVGSDDYTTNGLNQYTDVAGQALGYDDNGNLAGDGVWAFGYDPDNRLRTADNGGFSATLDYDAAGRLRRTAIDSATTDLLYDGTDLIAEYDTGDNLLLRRYVHGPGVDEPLVVYEGSGTAAKQWLYADHLGSVAATTDSTGSATATYTYGPFGEPAGTGAARFRYTGQQHIAELGLYYYKARFYSPRLGRFLQTDPIGYSDDLNLYAYAGNDPVNLTDPTGTYAGIDDLAFTVGGAIIGVAARGVGDLFARELSSWEDYAGAAVGGAVTGETLLYSGPVVAGLAGGFAGNATSQALKTYVSNAQESIDPVSLAIDTTVGGATGGLLKGVRIPGISSGRNSYSAIYKQMTTKFNNGTASTIKPSTALKMFAGRAQDTAIIEGAIIGAGSSELYEHIGSLQDGK